MEQDLKDTRQPDTGQPIEGAESQTDTAPETQTERNWARLLDHIDELTAADFEDSAVYLEWALIEDGLEREEMRNKLLNAARGQKRLSQARRLLKEVEKKRRDREKAAAEIESKAKQPAPKQDGYFSVFAPDSAGKAYPVLSTGSFRATDKGVVYVTVSADGDMHYETVCHHPLIPVGRLESMETGETSVKIAFKRGGYWKEIAVPRQQIAATRTIIDLAKHDIDVTSETARLLVRYLSDVLENNADVLKPQPLTSKMGWRLLHGQTVFVPFCESLTFDGGSFSAVLDSLTETGDFVAWINLVKDLRAGDRLEPRIAIAASLASVLVEPLGILPFIVDFYGQTGGGKTVTINLAASVWGNPAPGAYVGNFRSSDAYLEARADVLNNLPMILDDSKSANCGTKKERAAFFQNLIYFLCTGKGRGRSNKRLEVERDRTWKNCTICNGENPLSDYADSGGAINRIIEIECNEDIYKNPGHICEIINSNYGFLGRQFVGTVCSIPAADLKAEYKTFCDNLECGFDAPPKQAAAMAAILLADSIATDKIFHDGRNLTIHDVAELLTSKQTVSDGMRCYAYILECLEANREHFNKDNETLEQWGLTWDGREAGEQKTAYFYPTRFKKMLERAGFSDRAFRAWAKVRGLIQIDRANKTTIQKKVDGVNSRFVALLICDVDSDGYPIEPDFQPIEATGKIAPFTSKSAGENKNNYIQVTN